MKKILLGSLAALAIMGTACNKTCSDKAACAAADSASVSYGTFVGSAMLSSHAQNTSADEKADFIKGMQLVLGAKPDATTLHGMSAAMQMIQELDYFDSEDVKLDRGVVLNAFKKAFLSDSVLPAGVVADLRNDFSERLDALRDMSAAEQRREASESAESLENVKKGQDYVAEAKAADPEIKTAEDGLSYRIHNPGTEPRPSADARVTVNYTGRHLDGTEFDSTKGGEPAVFPLQGVVPGFREGVMLLGKGGKATVYIPGELAYGPDGNPGAGIGPNEMLVFDIELVDFQE